MLILFSDYLCKCTNAIMVSAPTLPRPPHYNGEGGGLNLKICQNFVGTKFCLTFVGNKPHLGELKLYGGVIFVTTLSLFHLRRNSYHPEK